MQLNSLKKIRIILIILYCSITSYSQTISPFIIGQNAHMLDFSWGKLDELWDDIDRANFTMIRMGGKGAMTYPKDYDKVFRQIDDIRLATAEPIIQVPHEYYKQEVIDYVTHINNTNANKTYGISYLIGYSNTLSQTPKGVNLLIPSELSGQWKIIISDSLGNVLHESSYEAVGGITYSWDFHNKNSNRVTSGSYILIAKFTDESGRTQISRRMIGVKE